MLHEGLDGRYEEFQRLRGSGGHFIAVQIINLLRFRFLKKTLFSSW